MSRVGILTFSDGREFVHKGVAEFVVCEAFGAEVLRGSGLITSSRMAVTEARRLAAQRPDLTIYNYPVWAFPHFSMHAAHATVGPLLLFSTIDPS